MRVIPLLIIFFALCGCVKSSEEHYVAPVTDLTISIVSESALQLSWTHSGSASGYQIDRKVGEEDWVADLYEVPATAMAFVDSGLTIGFTYAYRVTAQEGESRSNPVEVQSLLTYAVATPVFSLPPGDYNNDITVEITCATTGSTIRYTVDGSEPVETSSLYTGAVSVTQPKTLKARAWKAGWQVSETAANAYSFIVSPPGISPASGNYPIHQTITIACPTDGAQILYTTNGNSPAESGHVYSEPFEVYNNSTVKAQGFRSGWMASPVVASDYGISSGQSIGWDSGAFVNGEGFNADLDYTIFSRWSAYDLTSFVGNTIYSISFCPLSAASLYEVQVWSGGVQSGISADPGDLETSQPCEPDLYGDWCEVMLDHPIVIQPGREYWLAVFCNGAVGAQLGCDGGPAIDWKGDLVDYGHGVMEMHTQFTDSDYNWLLRAWIASDRSGSHKTELTRHR
jgi:hypothetical protein